MRRRHEAATVPTMETGLIMPFELGEVEPSDRLHFLNGVLFASGRLVKVEDDARVFGLVMAGYKGYRFGDDGAFTASVATELPLEEWDGIRKLELFVNDAVRDASPLYVAEYIKPISVEEATMYFRAMTKQEFGEPVPAAELQWPDGSLTLAHGQV